MWTSPAAGESNARYPTGGTTVRPSENHWKPRSMSVISVSRSIRRLISSRLRIIGSVIEHRPELGGSDVAPAENDCDVLASVLYGGLLISRHRDPRGAFDDQVVLDEYEADRV